MHHMPLPASPSLLSPSIAISNDGSLVAISHEPRQPAAATAQTPSIVISTLHDLRPISTLSTVSPVSAMAFSGDDRFLLVGLLNGSLVVHTLETIQLRQ
jgi:hypothetical protein